MQTLEQDKPIASFSAGLLLLVGCSSATQASDIEIYKSATKGEVVITMMLDTSGSMDLVASSTEYPIQKDGRVAFNLANRILPCDLPKNEVLLGGSMQLNQPHSDPQRKYQINYCMTQNGEKYLDRMSRLKDALYSLATSNAIDPTAKIGVGTYPYFDARTRFLDGDRKDTNRRAYIRISAEPWGQVGSAQRRKVLRLIEEDLRGNGGTPTSAAYAEAAAYMLGTTTKQTLYSGMHVADKKYSNNIVKGEYDDKRYISPINKNGSVECDGQGIYFLTDGVPESPRSTTLPSLMGSALNLYEYLITDKSGLSGGRSNRSGFRAFWGEIGLFSRYLNDTEKMKKLFNQQENRRIRTAVVGFGSDFDLDPNIKRVLTDPKTQRSRSYYDCKLIKDVDARNACNWGEKGFFSDGRPTIQGVGGYGEGGFYSAKSTDELIQSIVNFVEETKPDFDPLIMGSPTIPVDRLNPIQLHPFGYYATFIPKPASGEQLWQGNLNKYPIHNGELMDAAQGKGLIKNTGEIDQTAHGLWGQGGMKALLPLGTRTHRITQAQLSNRTVYSNRKIDPHNKVASSAAELKRVDLGSLLGIGADQSFVDDPDKNYWLNLLGFQVPLDAKIRGIEQLPVREVRQMGAVLHSKPILLTQKGRVAYVDGKLGTQDREDYLLFGTTQGVLHVVDQYGKEAFAFVPNEMLAMQKQAFLPPGSTSGGKDQLFYGVDATWTAHTQYVSTADGGLSVQDESARRDDSQQRSSPLMQRGVQWVYGGLRMGGKSYYALDLTDLSQPKFKFQIDPVNARIIHAQGETQVPELKYMGQSWSKPTLAYVNWQGKKKLVMLVGGGYDATGEVQCAAASSASTATQTIASQSNTNAWQQPQRQQPQRTDEGRSPPAWQQSQRQQPPRSDEGRSPPAWQQPQRQQPQRTDEGRSSPAWQQPQRQQPQRTDEGRSPPAWQQPQRQQPQRSDEGRSSPAWQQPQRQQPQRSDEGRSSPAWQQPQRQHSQRQQPQRQQPQRQQPQRPAPQRWQPDRDESAQVDTGRQRPEQQDSDAQEDRDSSRRVTGSTATRAPQSSSQPTQLNNDAEALIRYNNKGYECPNYQQSNAVGAGVYMFDANDGQLLWWSSVHAQDSVSGIQATAHPDLKYSVVSQINAIDRNNDGLVDTLYFGDLAGQAFRVDIDSEAHAGPDTAMAAKSHFAKRVVRLLNLHRDEGFSPRFYGMPSFSVHADAKGQLFAVMALSSGNLSSPLADANHSAQDGVFVVFDRDVARADLHRTVQLQGTLTFKQLPLLNLFERPMTGVERQSSADAMASGWWSPFSSVNGDFKGLNEIFSIDHVLYANVYSKNGHGIGGGCGARVVGDSYLFQYCLPFGRCSTPLTVLGQPNRMKIGAGILGTGLAKGYTNADGSLSVALNRQGKNSQNCRSEAFKYLPECQLFETQTSIKSMRWYERRSKI